MAQTPVILGIKGQELTRGEKSFFKEARPLGYILFKRNGDAEGRVQRIIEDLRDISSDHILILTDHEGGRVQRFTGLWHDWIPALVQCERLNSDDRLRALYLRYQVIGLELFRVGINVNCVPICDVAHEKTHPILKDRCYGFDVDFVCEAAQTVAEACLSAGVLPVIKHIPGHGRCHHDSHIELPSTDISRLELAKTDFRPFHQLRHMPLGMMAHVLYPSLDDECPSSQSPYVVSIVRQEIGFEGLLMTDDVAMSALQGKMAERAKLCLSAGCDVILHCNGDRKEMESVVNVSGPLNDITRERFDRALAHLVKPSQADISPLIEEYRTLFDRAGVQYPH